MVWKKPNDNESDIDPWGKEKNDDKKYDNNDENNTKKIIKKKKSEDIKNLLCNFDNNITNKNCSHNTSKKYIPSIFFIILISFFIWCSYGIYEIKKNERGVVTILGKFSHIVMPGLHWSPIFFNHVKIVNVGIIHNVNIKDLILTSDENIVRISMNVQYKINNPMNYVFSLSNPDDSFRKSIDSAIYDVIGSINIHQISQRGLIWIKHEIQKKIKQIIEPYHIGINISNINLKMDIYLNMEQSSLNNVIIHNKYNNQYINEAKKYCKEMELKTKIQAELILNEANIYISNIFFQAKKEIKYFSKNFHRYKKNNNIIFQDFNLKHIKKTFGNIKILFVNKNNHVFLIFPLDFFKNTQLIVKPIENYIYFNKNPYKFILKY